MRIAIAWTALGLIVKEPDSLANPPRRREYSPIRVPYICVLNERWERGFIRNGCLRSVSAQGERDCVPGTPGKDRYDVQ